MLQCNFTFKVGLELRSSMQIVKLMCLRKASTCLLTLPGVSCVLPYF